MEKAYDPTNLRGQAAEREVKRQRDQLVLQEELDDIKSLMARPEMRRFMWRLLEKAGVNRTSFTGNSTTFFNEGQRNIGLMMLSQILDACPEQYIVMLNEAKAKTEQEAAK